jgi:serine/threonine protein phosphatase PrpC
VTPQLRYAVRTDIGLLRDGNEDAAYAGPHLLVVADGMGGHAGGEVASAEAIAALAPLDDGATGGDPSAALRDAVHRANDRLRRRAAQEPGLEGMGTTLTALLWVDGRLTLAHLGDSRCYLLRDGHLEQLSHDHTLVQFYVDEGRLSPEEASSHPQRSVITKALVGREDVDADVSALEVRPGDRYLLCTDGLSGVVSEETLEATLQEPDPEQACSQLVDLALRGGGPDNVTCIVADMVDSPGGADQHAQAATVVGAAQDVPVRAPEPTRRGRDRQQRNAGRRLRARAPLLVALVLLLVLGAAGGAVYAWDQSQWYVGTDGKTVAIYQGVDASLGGLHFAGVAQRTTVPVTDLDPFDRQQLAHGVPVNSLSAARRTVANLRGVACAQITTSFQNRSHAAAAERRALQAAGCAVPAKARPAPRTSTGPSTSSKRRRRSRR